jgi:ATP-dependent Clp protease ATP-binding subunit ClpC
MFDAFSERARQIVFAARFKAGERGANLIDVEDFLIGLVLEYQGMLEENLLPKLYDGIPLNKPPSNTPFFSQEEARNLVTRIAALQTQGKPIGLSTEIPLSSALARVFGSAEVFQDQFRHSQIEPLHLLVAIVSEESSQCASLLQEFGIPPQKVMEQLRGTTAD